MRCVLYDDETLEPLTVLALPAWASTMLRAGDHVNVPVPEKLSARFWDASAEPIGMQAFQIVRIWFEPFVRSTHRRGVQRSWTAFTADAESSLRLRAVFLPGQQDEVQRREQEAVMRLIVEALR